MIAGPAASLPTFSSSGTAASKRGCAARCSLLRCSLCGSAHECVIRICNRMRSYRFAHGRRCACTGAHLQSADMIPYRVPLWALRRAMLCAGRAKPSSPPCGRARSIRVGLDRKCLPAALFSARLREGVRARGRRREQDLHGQSEPRRLPSWVLLAHSQR
jgi:hypothetical protein